jgi:histidinol-phosphate aminotransferase
VAERERVIAVLVELGLPTVASQANFLWLDVPDDAAALGARAERRGVVLRPFPDVGVRITIGAPLENDRMVAVLREAVADGAVRAGNRAT